MPADGLRAGVTHANTFAGTASSLHDQTQPGDVTVNGKEVFLFCFFFLVPPGNRFQPHLLVGVSLAFPP